MYVFIPIQIAIRWPPELAVYSYLLRLAELFCLEPDIGTKCARCFVVRNDILNLRLLTFRTPEISSQALTKMLNEVSADKTLRQILEKIHKQIPEEKTGAFLGYLSSLPKKEKDQVLRLIKENPDKVPDAIRGSSKNGVCK